MQLAQSLLVSQAILLKPSFVSFPCLYSVHPAHVAAAHVAVTCGEIDHPVDADKSARRGLLTFSWCLHGAGADHVREGGAGAPARELHVCRRRAQPGGAPPQPRETAPCGIGSGSAAAACTSSRSRAVCGGTRSAAGGGAGLPRVPRISSRAVVALPPGAASTIPCVHMRHA